VNFSVYVGLDPGEVAELYEQARKELDPASFAFIQDEDDPYDELSLKVEARTAEIAVGNATEIYTRLREHAGLPFRAPQSLFAVPTGSLLAPPRHFEFYELAEKLFHQGEHRFAVVAAQTACELYLEVAVTELLKARLEAPFDALIADLLGTFSMRDQRGPKVWEALTGERIQQAPCWANYERHVKRRNDIVHSGEEPTQEEALASIGAMAALFQYVADAWTANA
jgi:HEPN domain-containing protein